ncbi:MAG: thioredoxin [Armatimonadota bacterium]
MTLQHRRILSVIAMLALVGVLGLVAVGCEQEQDEKAEPAQKTTRDTGDRTGRTGPEKTKSDEPAPDEGPQGQIIKSDQASFQTDVLQSNIPVLVDFYADWCPPCRAMQPTLEEVADEYAGRLKVVKVDVDRDGALASRYGVRSIPALFVIKDGEVVEQTVGLQSKTDLERMFRDHLG